jgi:hypothetical protein
MKSISDKSHPLRVELKKLLRERVKLNKKINHVYKKLSRERVKAAAEFFKNN